jgi:TonB-dependent receptor
MEFKQIRTDTRYQDQLLITQDGKAWDPNGETPLWGYAKLLDIDHPIPGQGDRYNALTPLLNFPATPDSMYFSKAFSELGQNRESDPIVGQLDLKYAVTNNFKLKFGGKFRVKEGVHEHSLHTWIINPTVTKGKVFFMSQFDLEPLNERGGYLRELGPQYKASFIPFLTRKAFDNSGQFLTSLGDSIREYTMTPVNQEYRFWAGSRYQYTELQSAGYAMFEWTVRSKLNITAGVRVEHTQLEQSSDTLNSTPENLVYDPVTNNFYYKPETRYTRLNYLALLPGVNLTYSPNSQINLRAAVTRTFHRPNFAESKPGYAVISYSDFEFTFGNPAIRPAYSWNFDASLEYYFGAAGIFTIGGFYKHVTDHIFLVTTGDIDPFSGIIYKSYANAGTSFVAGAEISLTRKLTFLPGFLSGFGLSGNFTYSFSRMSVPGRKASQPLAGQTPFLYNVSLFYEKYRIQARVALNYTGPFLKGLNLAAVKDIGLLHTDTGFDLFQGENYTLDAHVSYGITPRLNIFLEGNNLLNWRYFEYRGRPERPTRIEYYRQRFQLGIKFNF